MNTLAKIKRVIIQCALVVVTMGIGTFTLASNLNFQVEATGLDSPRGIDTDINGNVYVAEAGHGNPSVRDTEAFGLFRSAFVGRLCEGNTGRVSKLDAMGNLSTVIDGLPSHGACEDFNGIVGLIPEGSLAFGPYGITVNEVTRGGKPEVELHLTMAASTEDTHPSMNPFNLGYCFKGGALLILGPPDMVTCAGDSYQVSDQDNLTKSFKQLFGGNAKIYNSYGVIKLNVQSPKYEIINNEFRKIEDITHPDHIHTSATFPTREENDTVGVKILSNQTLIVDAGANIIWRVDEGEVELASLLPLEGCDPGIACTPANTGIPAGTGQEAVPTGVAQSPDGHVYIVEYGGGGPGRIWEMDITQPRDPVFGYPLTQVDLGGFQHFGIIGLDFDTDGNAYVLEYAFNPANGSIGPSAKGRLTKLVFSDPHTAAVQVLDDESLVSPTGIAVGNGKIYISNKSDLGTFQGELISATIP